MFVVMSLLVVFVVFVSSSAPETPKAASQFPEGGLPMLTGSEGKVPPLGTGLLLAREIRGGRIGGGGEAIADARQGLRSQNAPRP
jgi:hypothetical protein